MRIKSLVLATALACSCVIQPANAGIQGTMESIFNSMTNTSKPGVYEGIRRGVVTGGGLSIQIVLSVPTSYHCASGLERRMRWHRLFRR